MSFVHDGSFMVNSFLGSACADGFFGPAGGAHCRGGFDFTFVFEESILMILPTVILLLTAPLRISSLIWEKQKVAGNNFGLLKLVREFHALVKIHWNRIANGEGFSRRLQRSMQF